MNFTQLYCRYDRSLVLLLGTICSLSFVLLAFNWQQVHRLNGTCLPKPDEMRVINFEYQLTSLPKSKAAVAQSQQPSQNIETTTNELSKDEWPAAETFPQPDLPALPDEIVDTTDIFVPGNEVFPTFPGGDAALLQYLSSKLRYTSAAIEHRIQGRVYLSFMVGIDGSISNVTVLRGLGFGLDQEAIRAVQGMPRWKPGYQNGRPVAVLYHLPVQFSLR